LSIAFESGHGKIGGRQKGTSNKKTLIKADDLLIELGINPIQRLLEIAESDLTSIDQKINCYKTIAQYTYPKFKSQELRVTPVEDTAPIKIEIVAYGEDKADEDKT
ncbi:MAG: hypothetical protein NZ811_00115, partial [Gammaproteobacteria bacterium]|nr:hypothetical protein [Gammaproteobacteria bacterium]